METLDQPVLERVIFPDVACTRGVDGEGLPLNIPTKIRVTQSVDAGVTARKSDNGEVYTVIKIVLKCNAEDSADGTMVFTASITVAGYFRHADGADADALMAGLEKNGPAVVDSLGPQLYVQAVSELHRQSAQAGLRNLRGSWSMPSVQEGLANA